MLMAKNPNVTIVAVVFLCLVQSSMGQAHRKKSPGSAAEDANKGVQLAQAGAYEEAIAALTRAIKLSPKDARIYDDRGWAYHKLNKFPEAIEDFSKAIEIAPKD